MFLHEVYMHKNTHMHMHVHHSHHAQVFLRSDWHGGLSWARDHLWHTHSRSLPLQLWLRICWLSLFSVHAISTPYHKQLAWHHEYCKESSIYLLVTCKGYFRQDQGVNCFLPPWDWLLPCAPSSFLPILLIDFHLIRGYPCPFESFPWTSALGICPFLSKIHFVTFCVI